MKAKIKKGDEIIVIAGKDKGKQGVVKQVLLGKRTTLLVEGINLVKKHVKPNPQANEEGGIVSKEAPLHISNVKLLNSATGKGDRVGYRVTDEGRKVRYFKSNNELVEADV